MEETGTVIHTRSGIATVRLAANAACGGCSQNGACHPGDAGEARMLEVRDSLGVSIGQEVTIQLPDSGIWLAMALTYGWPLAMLFTGAALGWYLGGGGGGGDGERAELWSALGAVLFLGGAFVLLHLLRPLYEGRASLRPRIVRKAGLSGVSGARTG
ncbi:MAG: SoxR reducing system RseC family protein [Nitrospirota bacterium]|nr:SoxR reducing system RseC family protein [Nitrospirota bacterium]